MDPATYIADLNDGNGTNSSDLDIRCFFVPFCDTEECDRTVHPYPLDCPKCSTPLVTIFVAVLIITALFISFGNLGIILVITKNQSFHNSFNMFKCSLAIADLLVGVFVVPSGAFEMLYILRKPYDKEAVQRADVYINKMGEPVRYDSLCDRIIKEDNSGASVSLSIISVLSVMASIFHLVLLSVDRFFAVRCPIKYNQGRALNNRMASLLIVIIWTICIILSVVLPIALGPDHFRYGLSPPMIFVLKTANGTTGMLYAALALGLPYVSLLGLNIATAWMLFKKRGKIRRQPSNVSNSNNNSRRSSEVKATITLLVMVLVFTITTIPPMAAVSFYNISGTDVNAEAYLHTVIYCILILLLISNSAWNFIIYSWRNDNFRKALKELLQCKTNGRRRRPRWKKVKRLVMRNSERKQRRKKLARLAGSCDVNHSDKMTEIED